MGLVERYGQRLVGYCSLCNRTQLLASREVAAAECSCGAMSREQVARELGRKRQQLPPGDMVDRVAERVNRTLRDQERAEEEPPMLRAEAEYTMLNPSMLLRAGASRSLRDLRRFLDATDSASVLALSAGPDPDQRRMAGFCSVLAAALIESPYADDDEEEEEEDAGGDRLTGERTLPVRHRRAWGDLGLLPELPFESICVVKSPEDLRHPETSVDLDGALLLPSPGDRELRVDSLAADVVGELRRTRILLKMGRADPAAGEEASAVAVPVPRSFWHECWSWDPARCDDERGRLPVEEMERAWKRMPAMARSALLHRSLVTILRGTNRARTCYLLHALMQPPLCPPAVERDFPTWRFRAVELSTAASAAVYQLGGGSVRDLSMLRNYALMRIAPGRLHDFLRMQGFRPDASFLARVVVAWCFLRKVRCDAFATGLSDFARFVAEQESRLPAPAPAAARKKRPRAKRPRSPGSASTDALRARDLKSVADVLDSTRLCLRCNERDVSCVMRPCGHAYACAECAPREPSCAVCKRPVLAKDSFQMWFSVPIAAEA